MHLSLLYITQENLQTIFCNFLISSSPKEDLQIYLYVRYMRLFSSSREGKLEKIRHIQTNENKTRINPMWSVNYCGFTLTLIFFFLMSSFFPCFRDWQNNECWKLNFMGVFLTLNAQASTSLCLFLSLKAEKSLIFNLLEGQYSCVCLFHLRLINRENFSMIF